MEYLRNRLHVKVIDLSSRMESKVGRNRSKSSPELIKIKSKMRLSYLWVRSDVNFNLKMDKISSCHPFTDSFKNFVFSPLSQFAQNFLHFDSLWQLSGQNFPKTVKIKFSFEQCASSGNDNKHLCEVSWGRLGRAKFPVLSHSSVAL